MVKYSKAALYLAFTHSGVNLKFKFTKKGEVINTPISPQNNTFINLAATLPIYLPGSSHQLTCPVVCVRNKASSPCIQPLSPPSQVWRCAPAKSLSSMWGDGPDSEDDTW